MKMTMIMAAILILYSGSAFAKDLPVPQKAVIAVVNFQGKWGSSNPFCQLNLVQKGKTLTGEYSTSPYADGRKVQDGKIEGTVNGNHARVKYSSSWADEDARGLVDLDLVNNRLKWTLVKSAGKTEEYAPDKVTLKRMTKKVD